MGTVPSKRFLAKWWGVDLNPDGAQVLLATLPRGRLKLQARQHEGRRPLEVQGRGVELGARRDAEVILEAVVLELR
eukprot:15436023-Alexandrium_andersonii.AAC.1